MRHLGPWKTGLGRCERAITHSARYADVMLMYPVPVLGGIRSEFGEYRTRESLIRWTQWLEHRAGQVEDG